MAEVVARAGQKVRCVEVGFGGKGCQNLTQGKEYTVVSGGGDESIVFEGHILDAENFEIFDDDGDPITCLLDGNWGTFEVIG
ncbi:TPA: hypothetical protein ACXYRX_002902 [Escherichia coli]